VRRLLERLPNDASFEDIQYQVYLLDEIARGSAARAMRYPEPDTDPRICRALHHRLERALFEPAPYQAPGPVGIDGDQRLPFGNRGTG
jgi:hypothetical protein